MARSLLWLAALLGICLPAPEVAAFVAFESDPVRPLALSPDSSLLFAVNTPDARLEIFSNTQGVLAPLASVKVGLEPVAVAARGSSEVWVVNHLSDSVSIVDVGAQPPRVVRTLLVGDEPRDIVFGGPKDANGNFRRAFITTARRGQNLPESIAPNLTTPGTPRALVYVFDATNLGDGVGGDPESIVPLFGDTPRALAVTSDGATVYAAVFQSGNRTTTVTEGAVCDGGAAAGPCELDGVQVPGGLPDGAAPGGLPAPNANVDGAVAPEVGLIVKYDALAHQWRDELGRNWNNAVRFDLPDLDVFRLDALANPPRPTASFSGVGTLLFNMLVHPTNGKVYVTNTEARNEVRFEGAVRGNLHQSRITILDGDAVTPRHLNKHIAALPQGYRTKPMPPGIKEASIATPLDMALAADGSLYVAGFGSSQVVVFDSAALERDSFTPSAATHIDVSGGGPCGLALDAAHRRLYVLTRFDNAIKVVDIDARREIAQHPLHNPEPQSVLSGRPFLYDARLTSSNGEASCATCHMFADMDNLAWDLGNPNDVVRSNPNPNGPVGSQDAPFHPMKGPMTTQTLRGMSEQGPMHWRGDRTGATAPGDPRALDSTLAFLAFDVAFDGLLGRDEGKLSEADMRAFAAFVLQIQPPPNPIRALDNQLNAVQAEGRRLFVDRMFIADNAASCLGCHILSSARGQFGTSGFTTFDDESQQFKVPQLKNMYQKVGMFGTPSTELAPLRPQDALHQGDQVRGFGFLHDGSMATIFDFLRGRIFRLEDGQRSAFEEYMFAFESTFAPIVGQQVTLTASNAVAAGERIDLMLARAQANFLLLDRPGAKECDLVAHAVVGGVARGYLFQAQGLSFQSDRANEPPLSDAELRSVAKVAGQSVTYTCAPPGEGPRLALDRDADGSFDRDELDAGTDPADPNDPPRTPTPSPFPTRTPTPPPPSCTSDCDQGGRVTVEEIVRGVNIARGNLSLDFCGAADPDFDGHVDFRELTQSTADLLNDCHAR